MFLTNTLRTAIQACIKNQAGSATQVRTRSSNPRAGGWRASSIQQDLKMADLKFIDIGANLTDGRFKGSYDGKKYHEGDIPLVLKRASDAGVDRIIVTGGSLQESRAALALAETDDRLYCTVGVHPTRCTEWEANGDPEKHYEALLALAHEGMKKGKIIAIGECGLDYDRLFFCPAEIQRKYFARQFDLAEATGLPMFLHMRAAGNDFCEIIRPNQHRFPGGVVHSFTSGLDDLQQVLEFGNLSFGVNGCSLKTAENLEVLKHIPVDKMMIETDAPFCGVKSTHAGIKHVKTTWPSKKKDKFAENFTVKDRCEPCHVRQVFEVVAATLGVKDVPGFAKTLHENTCRLFFPHEVEADNLANVTLSTSIRMD